MYSLKVQATEMLDLVQVRTTFLQTSESYDTTEVGEVVRRVEIPEGSRDAFDDTTAFLLAVAEALLSSWFGEDAPAWCMRLESELRAALITRSL